MKNTFGTDPMDQYSSPIKINKTKLSKIFVMKVRENLKKPGRILSVIWDNRSSLISGFVNNYSYIVTFKGKGNIAGNHYHKIKRELFFPVIGNFTVVFEDINSKIREEVKLQANKHLVLYIPKNISHVIRADSDIAILLITATAPGTENDEFPYKVL